MQTDIDTWWNSTTTPLEKRVVSINLPEMKQDTSSESTALTHLDRTTVTTPVYNRYNLLYLDPHCDQVSDSWLSPTVSSLECTRTQVSPLPDTEILEKPALDTSTMSCPMLDMSVCISEHLEVRSDDKKSLRIGMLNVNSINDKKFTYICEFLKNTNNVLSVLTELTSENTDTIHLLEKHANFPIITCSKNRRVGLIVPNYIRDYVEIVDSWQYTHKRVQNSQIAIQMTTYRVTFSTTVVTISAVYIVPDASVKAKIALCEKQVELEIKHANYMSAGDYNMDFKLKEIRAFFKTHTGGYLTQIVKKTTRKCTRRMKNRLNTSETTIDLVFLGKDLKKKLIGPAVVLPCSVACLFGAEHNLTWCTIGGV